MTNLRNRNCIRHRRTVVRLRRVNCDHYRLSAENGRGIEYRRRNALSPKVAAAADTANGNDVRVIVRLNHLGRWFILGLADDTGDGESKDTRA